MPSPTGTPISHRASRLGSVRRVLVTGMSGTGKSTALRELDKRGFLVVDTDVGGWTEWSEDDGGYVWREKRLEELLSREEGLVLYVSGTVSNQGRFYRYFDAVVLLSAPADVLVSRIENDKRLRKDPRRARRDPRRASRGRATAASNLHS